MIMVKLSFSNYRDFDKLVKPEPYFTFFNLLYNIEYYTIITYVFLK